MVMLSKFKKKIKKKKRIFTGRDILKEKFNSIDNQIRKNLKYINSDGEIFINIILDLDNNLLNEPIVFCPTVSEDALLIKEIKDQVSDDIKKFGKSFIDDNIMSMS